jgi:hypothetical protein
MFCSDVRDCAEAAMKAFATTRQVGARAANKREKKEKIAKTAIRVTLLRKKCYHSDETRIARGGKSPKDNQQNARRGTI